MGKASDKSDKDDTTNNTCISDDDDEEFISKILVPKQLTVLQG